MKQCEGGVYEIRMYAREEGCQRREGIVGSEAKSTEGNARRKSDALVRFCHQTNATYATRTNALWLSSAYPSRSHGPRKNYRLGTEHKVGSILREDGELEVLPDPR